MAVKPVALREIEKQSKNIYEAVVVMSKKARQINQGRYEEKVIDESEDISELDVLDELPQIDPENYEEKEKVTTEALDQFLSGEVQWETLEDEEFDLQMLPHTDMEHRMNNVLENGPASLEITLFAHKVK